jgi:hypothetical protein
MSRSNRTTLILTSISFLLAVILWLSNASPRPIRVFPQSNPPVGVSQGLLYFLVRREDRVVREPLRGGGQASLPVPGMSTVTVLHVFSGPDQQTLLQSQGDTGSNVRLWTIPAGERVARRLFANQEMRDALVNGPRCYWLRPRLIRREHILVSDRKVPVDHYSTDLMMTPLAGGAPRLLQKDVAADARLTELGEGVTWQDRDRNDTSVFHRKFVFPPDFRVQALPESVPDPVLAGNRLLWFEKNLNPQVQDATTESPNGASRSSLPPPPQLMSSDLSGGDRRQLNFPAGFFADSFTGVVNGRGFGTMQSPGAPFPANRLFVCDGKNVVTGPRSSGGHPWFYDCGKMYFLDQQQRERWWDFSPAGLSSVITYVLYEVVLPN